jgi:hypothetical protein
MNISLSHNPLSEESGLSARTSISDDSKPTQANEISAFFGGILIASPEPIIYETSALLKLCASTVTSFCPGGSWVMVYTPDSFMVVLRVALVALLVAVRVALGMTLP